MREVEPRQPRTDSDRAAKLRWLGQAHLEPGMNVGKFEYLMVQHGLAEVTDWDDIPDATLDEMIAEVHELAQVEVDAGPSAAGAYAWEPLVGVTDYADDPII